MRKLVIAATAVVLGAAGSVFPQTTLQQQLEQVQKQLQQLGSETPSPELPQQIQQATQQLILLGRALATPPRTTAPSPYTCEPVKPNATPEARALLKTLCDASGKAILTGQHNFPNERDRDINRIFEITGKYPAIWVRILASPTVKTRTPSRIAIS
jgi:hypothetical protein